MDGNDKKSPYAQVVVVGKRKEQVTEVTTAMTPTLNHGNQGNQDVAA